MRDDPVLVEVDSRRRLSLGRVGRHDRYLVREEADGTIVLEPAVVFTEAEARVLSAPELLARIEDNRAHPERRQVRRRRVPQEEER
jgi:hypothetical protein